VNARRLQTTAYWFLIALTVVMIAIVGGATKIAGTAGTRWTYTASGPVTNVAARLAALADGDGVLVAAATAERLPSGLPLEDLGELHLRNVEAPVRTYRLATEGAVPTATIG
jgi:class 3 adenylate cyclase